MRQRDLIQRAAQEGVKMDFGYTSATNSFNVFHGVDIVSADVLFCVVLKYEKKLTKMYGMRFKISL